MTNEDSSATYSRIIGPEEYNRLMGQHIFIPAADKAIARIVKSHTAKSKNLSWVVEIGSGPGRLTPLLLAPNHDVVGVDHDEVFLRYARRQAELNKWDIRYYFGDITRVKLFGMDVCVSQGVHHHIAKGQLNHNYLANIRVNLNDNGIYVLSDEILPFYRTEDERQIRGTIWYSHVIGSALRNKHIRLAWEEAKTLLDDLEEGRHSGLLKTRARLKTLMCSVPLIDRAALKGDAAEAERLAMCTINALFADAGGKVQAVSPDPEMNLSRGDYKVCHAVITKEVEEAGFRIVDMQPIGPVETIGGFGIYTLQKR